jgi:type II secretory pathway pseudopilin PulG
MGKFTLRCRINEKGLSLVEVLASIVILTLLLTTFLMMFVQSAKTNKKSEEIIDATYVAQTEMENIYATSSNASNEEMNKVITEKLRYTSEGSFKYSAQKDSFYLEIVFTPKLDGIENLTGVIVKVYNNKFEKKLEAQMETILSWGAHDK